MPSRRRLRPATAPAHHSADGTLPQNTRPRAEPALPCSRGASEGCDARTTLAEGQPKAGTRSGCLASVATPGARWQGGSVRPLLRHVREAARAASRPRLGCAPITDPRHTGANFESRITRQRRRGTRRRMPAPSHAAAARPGASPTDLKTCWRRPSQRRPAMVRPCRLSYLLERAWVKHCLRPDLGARIILCDRTVSNRAMTVSISE